MYCMVRGKFLISLCKKQFIFGLVQKDYFFVRKYYVLDFFLKWINFGGYGLPLLTVLNLLFISIP